MLHWCTQFSRKKLCGFVVPVWGCIMNLPCFWSVSVSTRVAKSNPRKNVSCQNTKIRKGVTDCENP